MNTDPRTLAISAAFAISVSIAAIWALGCDGSFAGIKIGPQQCWLKSR